MQLVIDENYEAYKEASRRLYKAHTAKPYDHEEWMAAQENIRIVFEKVNFT